MPRYFKVWKDASKQSWRCGSTTTTSHPLPCATCRCARWWSYVHWQFLGFLYCDYICPCVVNKQFELLEFVFDSVYVDLQCDEIYLILLPGLCACVMSTGMWSSLVCLWGCLGIQCCGCGGCVDCDACTVVCVWGEVSMQRGCEGARVTAMLMWGPADVCLRWVQDVSIWVVGIVRSSGVVSSADDVL